MAPVDNVEVVNNYYNDPVSGTAIPDSPVHDASFLQTADDTVLPSVDQTQADDPGLGVDWGSNIDPGPAPDPGNLGDSGGPFDSGNMAV